MLLGRYGDTSGRPYIEGRLVLPRLNLTTDVSFCIDTGADRTVLMPSDYRRIPLDLTTLQDTCETIGIGGMSIDYQEPALIAFSDSKQAIYVYSIVMEIANYSPDIEDLPSLLGRDILNRWRMNYHPMKKRLWCFVQSSDFKLDV